MVTAAAVPITEIKQEQGNKPILISNSKPKRNGKETRTYEMAYRLGRSLYGAPEHQSGGPR